MCAKECEIESMEYLNLLFLPLKHNFASLWEFPWLKTALTVIASFITFFIHSNVMGVGVLVGLVLIDQLTGVWLAFKNNSFNSSAFRNGLIKLLMYFIIIGAFHSLSYVSLFIFGWMGLDTGALAWLAITEVISIVENACMIAGLPFPNGLLDKLRVFVHMGKKKDN